MIRKIFLTVAATLVAVTGLFAQELPDDPEVRKGVLDNGMTYYIRHNNKPANQAEFWIFDNVGALQEEDSQQGLAHFLEHMAFNGTENFPGKNMINYLESIGVKFGANLNAFTAQEMTCYNMSNVPVTREGVIDSTTGRTTSRSTATRLTTSAVSSSRSSAPVRTQAGGPMRNSGPIFTAIRATRPATSSAVKRASAASTTRSSVISTTAGTAPTCRRSSSSAISTWT